MNKDTFYFSHDYNTRTDDKIKMLIRKHGMEGYGIYWSIVEDLYNNSNTVRLDYEGIAYDLHTQQDRVKSIINDFDLFIIAENYFGSSSIERRLKVRNEKSEKARQSISKRWGKNKPNTNVLPTLYETNTIKDNIGKENKENILIDESHPFYIDFLDYQKWVSISGDNVKNMTKQLTIDQYGKLVNKYSKDVVIDIINKMNNYKPLTNNCVSVYDTATTWINKNLNKTT